MATTPTASTGAAGTSGTSSTASGKKSNDALRGLDLDQFLKLMISELQNQDPLNPMDNSEMLNQISQIREIGATDKLTGTLDAVLLGQNLTSASSLIGKQITALDDNKQTVTGKVDKVSVVGGVPKLHVGDQTVTLDNIRDISGAAA